MTKEFVYNFIKEHQYAVLATVTPQQLPEAALMGIAVMDDLSLIFDTVKNSRKFTNLAHNAHIAFVIGMESECTLQYEGIAMIPTLGELDEVKECYFATFPDGKARENWPGITYFCVKPKWVRYSDYTHVSPHIEELLF